MSTRPRAVRWVLEGLLMVMLVVGVFAWKGRHLLPGDGRFAPVATFKDLDGRSVRLDDYAGKQVLLHFWATWCGVCGIEHGALNAVQAKLKPDQVLLAVVGDGDDPARIKRYAAEHGLTYPILTADRAVLKAFNVSQYPTNYYLDPAGRIVGGDVGMSSRFGMRTRLGCAGD